MTEAGQLVGDYQVLAQLGVGGMGRVYKVRNVISNREEAMKILLPDFASDKELAARFMAEIRTLATLEHPGIAQLRTAFQSNNQFVMVMEFVEGTTLEKLAAAVRIPLDKVLDYAGQVLEALSYAHSRGVIHRDIKPANIMITTHGLVKLMDFGIAKSTEDMQLTRPGTTMGSVYYMSPEQVRGAAIDARSDLYSFGVTLYEMLTGHKPFQADTSYSVLNAQLNQAPTPPVEVNPAIPAPLNAIVLKAMAKAPEERFQTASEFRDALRAIRIGHAAPPVSTVATPHAPPPATAWTPVSPSPASSATAAGPAANATTEPNWAPVPQAAPVPVGAPARVAGNRSHRGLWIVVGAVTAILALIAIATVLPRFLSRSRQNVAASAEAPAQPVSSAPAPDTSPSASPVSPPPASPASVASPEKNPRETQAAQPSANPPARQPYRSPTAGYPHAPATPSGQPAPAVLPSQASTAPAQTAPASPSGPSSAELTQAQDRLSNLQARADAALSGVESIRSQQQASGLDLRGDILAAMNRLKTDLREADRALQRRDLESANSYLQRGENETNTLEKFLGR